ncbi:MAG: hypothetical protein WBF71_12435 [Microthrixaceae bacterium]
MSIPLDSQARFGLARSAGERLVTGLGQVLDQGFVRVEGQRVDVFVDGIVVSSFNLFDRPTDDGTDDDPSVAAPYAESAFNARRRIGLIVMRRLADHPQMSRSHLGGAPGGVNGRGPELGGAVSETLKSVMDSSEGWPLNLRDWVEGLEPAGRAAVMAAASAWCEGALRLVGADSRVTWTDPQYPNAWLVPGRLVRLQANVDATTGTPASGERLFVVSEALPSPTDRIRAGFVALVRAVGTRSAPERVTIGAPSRGSMERFDVTGDLLDLTVDQVIETVALAARSHRNGETRSPNQPGSPNEPDSTNEPTSQYQARADKESQ